MRLRMGRADDIRPYEGKRIATPVCALARNDTGFGRLQKRTVGDAGPYSVIPRPVLKLVVGIRNLLHHCFRKGKRIATGINAFAMTQIWEIAGGFLENEKGEKYGENSL